jgi:hypothetical protein
MCVSKVLNVRTVHTNHTRHYCVVPVHHRPWEAFYSWRTWNTAWQSIVAEEACEERTRMMLDGSE